MHGKVLSNTKIFQLRSGQFSKVLRNTKIFQLRSGQSSKKMNVTINVFGGLREI